ncbi:hypothetical protein FKW77_006333 [Venturia effusa]|uniref:EthD domain-containing protein n=1 Tax=Venturia effusa TaxID=50376 RepID=A0A517L5I7_9PEZI|nr:hypothetical protein FKW77_006333 [Venturia effusa]
MAKASSSPLVIPGISLTGPGLITSHSNITKPEAFSDDQFNTWYNNVHIPDVLATGAVTAAYRFHHADPESPKPYMAVYFVPDLSAIQSEGFQSIPMTHSSLPDGVSMHALAHFDTRIYSFTQEHVKDEQEPAGLPYPNLLVAAMEPGPTPEMAADLDAWYRQEHLEQMSKEPGWPPSSLLLYEFDKEAKLGTQVQPLDPMTDWTKKCMQEAQKIETGIYRKMSLGA